MGRNFFNVIKLFIFKNSANGDEWKLTDIIPPQQSAAIRVTGKKEENREATCTFC